MKNDIKNTLAKSLENIKKTLQKKEMLCASYAYDYEKNKREESLLNFRKLWDSFTNLEKRSVITYFYSFNNYEMLNTLKDLSNLSIINKTIGEFITSVSNEDNDKVMRKNKR